VIQDGGHEDAHEAKWDGRGQCGFGFGAF
jgi:hypothetical protein